MVSPDSVWYALALLCFSATAQTNTGSKTFDCALVLTLEAYDDPDNGNYCNYCYNCSYCHYNILSYFIVIIVIIELIDCI